MSETTNYLRSEGAMATNDEDRQERTSFWVEQMLALMRDRGADAFTSEGLSYLYDMMQNLDALKPLHDSLDGTGIHFFDLNSPLDWACAYTLENIGGVVDAAALDGDETYKPTHAVVFYTLTDVADLWRGQNLRLHVSLLLGDDGHDAEERTREMAAVVCEKLSGLNIRHDWDSDGEIIVLKGQVGEWPPTAKRSGAGTAPPAPDHMVPDRRPTG
jgi:hypothetical protein